MVTTTPLMPGVNSATQPTELKLPAGWRMNANEPGAATMTQDDVDAFIDTYYRTGPGANLASDDYSLHTRVGAWNPAAAAAGKSSYMAEHPNFDTQPFVPGGGPAGRKAAIDALLDPARTGIKSAFTTYGADPTQYDKDIEDRLASIVAGIPQDAKDFSTFFPADLGTKLIGDLETGRRNKLKNDFSSVPTDFFPMTSDDPFIESLLGEQRTDADQFIQRMIDRGIMSSAGAEGARKDLDRQAGLGRTKLTEIGTGLLTGKEAELDAERSKRLGSIDKLKLTDAFDVGSQKTDLNKLASDFIGTLGTGLKTGLGSAKLFDTSGLAKIGSNTGAAPGGTITGPPPDDQQDEVLKTGNEILF